MSKVDISDFARKLDALSDAYRKVPNEVAALAVNFSKERFREQSWVDKSKEKWKPRAQRRKGGAKKSQTLLVNKGRLKRSIRKIHADENSVLIGTDVPYAQIQNDGGTIKQDVTVKSFNKKTYSRQRKGRKETVKAHAVRSHSRKMKITIPARRFIGDSYTLQRRIYLLIASRFAKALKQ
jgi:phage gpG-like protein